MSLLKERGGKRSVMRITFLVWNIVVAGVWIWLCISKNEMVDIPHSVVTIVGLGLAAKVGQRFVENKDPSNVQTVTTGTWNPSP